MKMLNYDRKLTEDIVKRGNNILGDLSLHNQSLQVSVTEAMGSVTLKFSGDL
jgi:hypothetical protein